MASAIDPDMEVLVSTWQDKVVTRAGDALPAEEAGAFPLRKDEPLGILIGHRLGESLEVEIDDEVVFMAEGDEGVESRLFRVKGFLKTGVADLDGVLVMMTVGAGQDLLRRGDSTHQISVHLNDPTQTDAQTAVVQGLLAERSSVEVLPWPKALPNSAEDRALSEWPL